MRVNSSPGRLNRVVAAAAMVSFIALALVAGLFAPPVPRVPVDVEDADRAGPSLPAAQGLAIAQGPEVVLEGGRRLMRWQTSAPADSLLTCGRHDAFETVLAKDSRLVTEHCFELPELPFIEFCRFHVRSTDAYGNVATGHWNPGEGSSGALFVNVSSACLALCTGLQKADATAWADYDSDGDHDVVLLAPAGGGPPTLLRCEGGRFEEATSRHCPQLEGSGASWADFDGDGDLDLLTCGERLVLYRNSGPPHWTLEPLPDFLDALEPASVRSACFAQMDGDGLPDILAADDSGGLRALLNTARGPRWFRSSAGPHATAGTGQAVQKLLCADFNGDGLSDALVCASGWSLFRNTGGRLERMGDALPELGAAPRAVGLADYDADGDLDAYLAPSGGSGGLLLANDGSGRFRAASDAGDLSALEGTVSCAAWADLTGNGYPDLVVGLVGGGVRVFLSNGSGMFLDGTHLCGLPEEAKGTVRGVVLADFNGDSAPDMLVQLEQAAGLLLANRCVGAAHGGFITVKPAGNRGLIGATVILRDAHNSGTLASGQIASGDSRGLSGPLEVLLGVGNLQEALVEVQFADGLRESVRWVRGSSPRVLIVGRSSE